MKHPVAPGAEHHNVLGLGIAGRLHANFDRQEGGQNVDPDQPDKRKPRVVRPGAILLPNLDIDEDPSAPRARSRYDDADALVDDKVNDGDDHLDVTYFTIAEPSPIFSAATKVTLKVAERDSQRIRIWQLPENGDLRDPAVKEVIGPSTGHEHVLHEVTAKIPEPAWVVRFAVEALTLVGDPALEAPTDAVPPPPGARSLPPAESTGGSEEAPKVDLDPAAASAYPERAASDVWIELVHEAAGAEQADLRDLALFTLAPWIMTWNTLPCERVYVTYISVPTTDFLSVLEHNHSMVWELQAGCAAAGLCPAPDPDTSMSIATSDWRAVRQPDDVPFYVIPPASNYDRWVQDEFEVGYCYAPHHWLHIAFHTPRGRGGLEDFVRHMAHPRLGVFEEVNATVGSNAPGTDYGGNLEVSPPVAKATKALNKGRAGPSVKAHRPAPFGKILLGDGEYYPASEELREFLIAQRVQPVLPVDTAWLSVGHVDEILSFARASDATGFQLLFASVELMNRILEEVLKVDEAATLHAGKYNYNYPSGWAYAEEFVADWRATTSDLYAYSQRVEKEKLRPIRNRLKEALDIDEREVLSLPVYWKVPANKSAPLGQGSRALGFNTTIAENVGMVNMLVVDNHLLVPRPHGPRLPTDKARRAAKASLDRWFGQDKVAVAMPPSTHYFWARPGERLSKIAAYFVRSNTGDAQSRIDWRNEVIQRIPGSDPLTGLSQSQRDAISALEQKIKNQVPPALLSGDKLEKWYRVEIDDGTADVFEIYVKSILESVGNTVYFVENFECYHALSGEVHCGTNVKRTPPEADKKFTPRWWDKGVFDPDYDTSYDPST